MSTPKLFPVKPNEKKSVQPRRSKLPVAVTKSAPSCPPQEQTKTPSSPPQEQTKTSSCPPQEHTKTPSCPPQEQTKTKRREMPKITESNSELKKSSRRPVSVPTATPSLSLTRSVSASIVETRDRPRARHKPPVLSYNHLSQENQRLQGDLASLRQEETERREEQCLLRSEIEHLTVRLTAANTAVSELSEGAKTHREQTDKLLSVLEGQGIDPLSGEEVLTREERMDTSRVSAERTRALTEYLNEQTARYREIQSNLREGREEILRLLSEQRGETGGNIETILTVVSLVHTPGSTGTTEEVPHSACD